MVASCEFHHILASFSGSTAQSFTRWMFHWVLRQFHHGSDQHMVQSNGFWSVSSGFCQTMVSQLTDEGGQVVILDHPAWDKIIVSTNQIRNKSKQQYLNNIVSILNKDVVQQLLFSEMTTPSSSLPLSTPIIVTFEQINHIFFGKGIKMWMKLEIGGV